MAIRTCPACGRQFGAVNRGHICKSGTTIDALAERSLPTFLPIVHRVRAHLESLPGVSDRLIVDPLERVVQFKHRRTFAMLTPRTKWTALSISLDRRVGVARWSRKIIEHPCGYHHVINLVDVDAIDDEILEWLTEAYDSALIERMAEPSGGDLMVPDDVDLW